MLVSSCPVLLTSSKLTYFMSMDSQGVHIRKLSKSYALLYILDINVTVLFWWIKKFFIMVTSHFCQGHLVLHLFLKLILSRTCFLSLSNVVLSWLWMQFMFLVFNSFWYFKKDINTSFLFQKMNLWSLERHLPRSQCHQRRAHKIKTKLCVLLY